MLCKKAGLFCHVPMVWTFVNLFCTKRLFSQETVFLPDNFSRDKNGFVLQQIEVYAINKFRARTLWRILNYSTEHLKVLVDSYFLRIEKERAIFRGSKQMPQSNTILSQEKYPEYLIC